MVQDKPLYWTYFKVWIYGIVISFPLCGLVSYLFRSSDPNWVLPIALSILFYPFVLCGIYGIKQGYCMCYKYGHIYRGNNALFWNLLFIILYIFALIFFISIGGENLI